MLLQLKIKNLAIIESVELTLGAGLNVLTGETGAGKSILLAALSLVLGGRSDRTLVRKGQSEAWVEALFDVEAPLLPLLQEAGIEADPDEPLALRRIVQSNGRSRAFVNCITVPAQLLKQLAPHLIDFGRQHDQAVLMNSENHLGLLDRFAGAEVEAKRVENAYREYVRLQKEHDQLQTSRGERREREEFLYYQQESILKINPEPGEDKALEQKLQTLSQRESLQNLAKKADALLYADDDSAQAKLAAALVPVEEIAALDPTLVSLSEDLHHALVSIEEVARSLQSYKRNISLDTNAMEEIRERLDALLLLQDKHGGSLESVLQRLEEIEEELEELAEQTRRETEILEEIEAARLVLIEIVVPLSQKRAQAADALRLRVERELHDLAMPGARFLVHFAPLKAPEGIPCPGVEPPCTLAASHTKNPDPTTAPARLASVSALLQEPYKPSICSDLPNDSIQKTNSHHPEPHPQTTSFVDESFSPQTDEESKHEEHDSSETLHEQPLPRLAMWGAERGFFYLAANEGEEPYPLERVASGGELSRILLALKRVLADASDVQTFVFDEIDAGVAGAAATMVAKKLRQIASPQNGQGQILCISHTPQIAAEADQHFHVRKKTLEGRTRSSVTPLSHNERITEVARMLAGDQSSESALELARQLVVSPPLALAS